jgi:hypothetical protein
MIGIVCIKILNTILSHKHGGHTTLNGCTVEKVALTGAMPCVVVVVVPTSVIVSVITGIIVMGDRLLI